ncbi:MAG: hypothetical protein WCL06_10085, partial [Bacteroidota bacterium]
MAETGIIPNIEHFTTLISSCTVYTTRYNPSNPKLLLTALNTILTNANNAVDDVTALAIPRTNVITTRQELFATLPAYTTRIVGALSVSEGVTTTVVEKAKYWIRKIRGERKSKKILNPSPEDPKQISASQRSYFNQAEFFAELIEYVLSQSVYTPNETDLKQAALEAFATSLDDANNSAIEANAPWLNALAARDHI